MANLQNLKWWLERREPKVFGRHPESEAQQPTTENPFKVMADEELADLCRDMVISMGHSS